MAHRGFDGSALGHSPDLRLYWTNQKTGTIGRANLDGTGVNQNFITGAPGPNDVVVDSVYIYWTNYEWPSSLTSGTTIGRVNLDGTQPNENFIAGAAAPAGLAIQT